LFAWTVLTKPGLLQRSAGVKCARQESRNSIAGASYASMRRWQSGVKRGSLWNPSWHALLIEISDYTKNNFYLALNSVARKHIIARRQRFRAAFYLTYTTWF
jgi:hypothetical protein